MILFAAYIIAWALAFLLLLWRIRPLIQQFKETRGLSDSDKKEKWNAFIDKKTSELKSSSEISVEDLQEESKFLFSFIYKCMQAACILLVIPIAFIRLGLILNWGLRITWVMPFSLYEIWTGAILAISCYYIETGREIAGVSIAIWIAVSMMYSITSFFEKKKGDIRIFNMPLHKLNLPEVLIEALAIVVSFGCFFRTISIIDPKAFSEVLSLFDAMYYSLVTAATVGFGDIVPKTYLAKSITMIEILFSYIFIVLIISRIISVWASRYASAQIIKSQNNNRINSDENG